MPRQNDDNLIDTILSELGIGKFQINYYSALCLAIVFTTTSAGSFIFTSRDTSYRCLVPECESPESAYEQPWLVNAVPFADGIPHKCERFAAAASNASPSNGACSEFYFDNSTSEPCTEWIYGSGDTIVKGFNLPCEHWKRTLIGSVNCAGQLVSLLFSGFLSDKYGRRNVMILMTASVGVIGLVQSFARSYWFFVFLEFLNLAAGSGAYMTAYVLGVEILTPDKRITGCALMDITNTCSTMLLSVIAWIVISWRVLLRVANVPALLILITFFTIPESVRWLYTKGRHKECTAILKKAAKMNNIPISATSIPQLQKLKEEEGRTPPEELKSFLSIHSIEIEEKVSIMPMLQSPVLLLRLIISAFCWFSAAFVYYGIAISSVMLSHDENTVYWNYIVISTAEIASTLLYFTVLRAVGRKTALLVNMVGSGVACIVYATAPVGEVASLILFWIGKLFTAMCFSLLYITTSEMFPTSLRNSTMNVCSIIGRVGAALASQVLLLHKYHKSLPMLFYGILAIICGTIILKLPETRNKSLPNTIQEAEALR